MRGYLSVCARLPVDGDDFLEGRGISASITMRLGHGLHDDEFRWIRHCRLHEHDSVVHVPHPG